MATRFVYPRIDMFYMNRGMTDCAYQLLIASDTDDGKCWFGIRKGIEAYCEEYGCDIKNIVWRIRVKPKDEGFATIRAESFEDWVRQFNALGVKYEIEKEERWA